jgi:hypothetical protein
MRHKVLVTATLAALLVCTGCMRSMTSTTYRPDATALTVRFVLPTEQERYAGGDQHTDTQLVVDSAYEGFSGSDEVVDAPHFLPGAYHVALWGGSYDGANVTTRSTSLVPGSYTFAYFDHPHDALMQGWLDVRTTGSDLLSMLTKWRDWIPEQKKRLAFAFEIDGRMREADPEVFQSFQKQIDAYDQLHRKLQQAIDTERRVLEKRRGQVRDLFDSADVVIMPGQNPFFRATTEPAFTEADLDDVRAGNVVTKLVMAANYQEARWKLRQLDQLYDDVSRFKEVLKQEVDRLERRKGLYLLTDHLHRHDKRFVENEMQLQYTLGLIDRINRQTSDLREHRMALAFVTSLFAPDADFAALDQERQDLMRERAVMEAERQRLDRLVEEIDQNSTRWVTHERHRQDAMAGIESLDQQIADVDHVKTVLMTMNDSTDVIHRYNDMRLVATTFVADQLPLGVRNAVEREAMMTVRLQTSDKVFAPGLTGVAAAYDQPMPYYANEPFLVEDEQYPQNADAQWDQVDRTSTHTSDMDQQRHASNVRRQRFDTDSQVTTRKHDPDQQRQTSNVTPQRFETRPDEATTRTQHTDQQRHASNVRRQRFETRPQTTTMQDKDQQRQTSNVTPQRGKTSLTARRMQDADQQQHAQSARARRDGMGRRATLANTTVEPNQHAQPQVKKRGCGLPTIGRFLVPPCWFLNDNRETPSRVGERPYKQRDNTRKASLADHRSEREPRAKKCNMPWFFRLFVPPCWFFDDANDQDNNNKNQQTSKKQQREAKLAQHRDQDEPQKEPHECHWLVRLLVPPCWFVD